MKKFPVVLFFLFITLRLLAQVEVDGNFYHLRNSEPREWSEFPQTAFGRELVLNFEVGRDNLPTAISLRQYDVKLDWIVELNGSEIGSLYLDEKDLVAYHLVDRSVVRIGNNTLRIYCRDSIADDIRVGELILHPDFVSDQITRGFLNIEVIDENKNPVPSHLTIVNDKRVLQSFSTTKGPYAARPGHIYSATGKIQIALPEGKYIVFAGRGFEYSVDSAVVEIKKEIPVQKKLSIKREVNTRGWISTDTHVHTFTHSQHGDATDWERVITFAGEGIDLPIITDHNRHVNLKGVAKKQNVDRYFTLVTGNEVTSKVGHFNVFPIDSIETVKSSTAQNWAGLQTSIEKYRRPKVIILNHARDIHNNFRPHDPSRFLAIAGQRLDGEPIFANAMEVINSGSQQSDWMQLFNDWMHLLNGGYALTPVGSSDSHDVSRFIVGQGRTYIRGNDSTSNGIDIHEVVDNFLNGKVMVSCGLLASLKINNTFGPGEVATASHEVVADIEVSGPSWSKADKIVLYVNGEKFKEEKIIDQAIGGVKWRGKWTLPKSAQDYHVVAIAEGPGDHMVFWPIAKPYQPTSPDWIPRVIGASGAVWVDADGNGKRESANAYANEILLKASGDIDEIISSLERYDESVAIQVAALLHLKKVDLTSAKILRALKKGDEKTQSGFNKVVAGVILSRGRN